MTVGAQISAPIRKDLGLSRAAARARAIDVTIQTQILELLHRLQKELNLAIVIITHDLGVIAELADRDCVMYGGRIVDTATASSPP